MMSNDYEHYTYRITWSEDDGEYVGLCAELPSLSYLAKTKKQAFDGIVNLVGHVVNDMQDHDETIPKPIAETNYSGKFQVCMPKEMHRMLAIRAAEQGVSLDRYIKSKLVM